MSLALLGDKTGIPFLVKALDGDLLTGAPVTAARYLAGLDEPRGFPVILKALNSKLAGIRLAAAVALRDFLKYHGQKVGGQTFDLVAILEKTLQDPEPLVRRELLYKLAMLDTPGAGALLQEFSQSDTDEGVRQTAGQIIATKKTSQG